MTVVRAGITRKQLTTCPAEKADGPRASYAPALPSEKDSGMKSGDDRSLDAKSAKDDFLSVRLVE